MDLLDRYIAEIGKNLPRKNRADVQVEIRSTLQDMLEDRSQQAGKPVDDELTSQVIKEYGAPAKVAAAYKPTQFLVGPRLFPIFALVLKIVLTVLFAVGLAGLAISMFSTSMSGPEFAKALLRAAGQFLTGGLTAFGNIVIIFAILERTLPASEFEEEPEEWDPAELTREPDPDQTKRGELTFDIVFTVIWLVIFNLYPQWVGVAFLVDGHWTFVPMLSQAFFVYLPWLNLLWVLGIVLDVLLIRAGAWSTLTRVAKIALSIAEILLAAVMLRGPSLVTITPGALANTQLGVASGIFSSLMNLVPVLVLGIVIVVNTVEVIQQIRRLIAPPSAPVFPTSK